MREERRGRLREWFNVPEPRGKVGTARCAVRTSQRDVPTYKLSFTANMAVPH